jgi:hypothetical protein
MSLQLLDYVLTTTTYCKWQLSLNEMKNLLKKMLDIAIASSICLFYRDV